MFSFPEWSDLGKTSQLSRNAWQAMQARIEECRRDNNDTVFEERGQMEEPTAEALLMYPTGLEPTLF